jgi:hypothetical protein
MGESRDQKPFWTTLLDVVRPLTGLVTAIGIPIVGLAAAALIGGCGAPDSYDRPGGQAIAPEPTQASILAPVDQEVARLEKANIAFSVPDTLQLGESSTIQLLLSTQESIPELRDQIDPPGPTEGAEIEVSAVMKANLSGPGFLISPISGETQLVSGSKNTKWLWEIIPKNTGLQTLNLTLNALISYKGVEREYFIESFAKDIPVSVTGVLKPLKEAEINFDPPEAVELDKQSIVKLLVSPRESVGLARTMEARLTGRGFDIQPLTPEIQPVRESNRTEWQWEVVPYEPGSQSLHLGHVCKLLQP